MNFGINKKKGINCVPFVSVSAMLVYTHRCLYSCLLNVKCGVCRWYIVYWIKEIMPLHNNICNAILWMLAEYIVSVHKLLLGRRNESIHFVLLSPYIKNINTTSDFMNRNLLLLIVLFLTFSNGVRSQNISQVVSDSIFLHCSYFEPSHSTKPIKRSP